MDMSFREWLMVIGGVFILIVAIDGFRRARRSKREALEMTLGMGGGIDKSPLDEDFNPELPGGGARTLRKEPSFDDELPVARAPVPPAPQMADDGILSAPRVVRPASPEDEPPGGVTMVDRQENEVDAFRPAVAVDEPVQAVAEDDVTATSAVDETPEPVAAAFVADRDDAPLTASRDADLDNIRPDLPEGILSPARPGKRKERVAPAMKRFTASVRGKISGVVQSAQGAMQGQSKEPAKPSSPKRLNGAPREVIILNVLREQGEHYTGRDLVRLFEACGMSHGEMGIYHRHETESPESPVQFSVANAIHPGTFNPGEVDGIQTPGVSFFMSLPGPSNNMRAFDYMLETANALARNLGGAVKDERRSAMTSQTIEHCRQRIREFERRLMSERV